MAQTSDWAQGEEKESEEGEDGATWENQGDLPWTGQDSETEQEESSGVQAFSDGVDEVKDGGEEEASSGDDSLLGGGGGEFYPDPPEEAKLYVGNLPFDVDSEKLADLFNQAGIVEIAEVKFLFFFFDIIGLCFNLKYGNCVFLIGIFVLLLGNLQ